jgi:hypothetical protein
MKFTLEIELGNEAMQTAEDVAEFLREKLVRRVEACTFDLPEGPYLVKDRNGNTVGEWSVTETSMDDEDVDDYDDGTAAACDEFLSTLALSASCARCGEPYNDHSTAAKGSH